MKTLSTWGFYINPTDKKQKIADSEHDGVYEWCARPQDTTGEQHLVKFGNNFDSTWVHPREVKHDNWHFWDNPEFCHLLYPNPANPQGAKTWIRLVKGSIMTTQTQTPGEDYVNQHLKQHSRGVLKTWRDIYAPRPVKHTGKRALIITSSPNCHLFYYQTSREQWRHKIQTHLEKQGWSVETRIKTGRKDRNGGNQLYKQLETGRYDLVINQHSASTIESILAGVPVVCDNLHCGGNLIVTWDNFIKGADPILPNTAEVEQWMQVILGNIRHKTTIGTNAW